MTAKEKIEAQQEGKEYTDAWMVGEQLKDILRSDPSLEELIFTDLDVKDMSLADCAGKTKSWAGEQKSKVKGRCVCVPPNVAEGSSGNFTDCRKPGWCRNPSLRRRSRTANSGCVLAAGAEATMWLTSGTS